MQRSWFTELDSSTDAKFSRHMTLRLPGHAFACNRHVGAFIACVLASEKVSAWMYKELNGYREPMCGLDWQLAAVVR